MADQEHTEPEARELTQKEQEALSKRAHVLEKSILKRAQNISKQWWELSAELYEFQERGAWAMLGYEKLEEFLAQPGLGMTRSQFFRLTRVYRDLVVTKQIDAASIADIDPSTLDEVRPALMRAEAQVDTVLADARALGRSDLREKYGPPKKEKSEAEIQQESEAAQAAEIAANAGNEPVPEPEWDAAPAEGESEPEPDASEAPGDAGPEVVKGEPEVAGAVTGEVLDPEPTLTLTVKDIEKFGIAPGDTFVLTVEQGGAAGYDDFIKSLKSLYPDTRFILLEEGVKLEELPPALLADAGVASLAGICGVVSASGPNQEPLACGFDSAHGGPHSWATLPTFAPTGDAEVDAALVAPTDESELERVRRTADAFLDALAAFRGDHGHSSVVAAYEDAQSVVKDFELYVERHYKGEDS